MSDCGKFLQSHVLQSREENNDPAPVVPPDEGQAVFGITHLAPKP